MVILGENLIFLKNLTEGGGVDENFLKKKFLTDQYQNLISSGHSPGAYLFQIAKHLDQRFVSYRSTTENEVMTSGDLDLRSSTYR